jgi:hypothetical protein
VQPATGFQVASVHSIDVSAIGTSLNPAYADTQNSEKVLTNDSEQISASPLTAPMKKVI